MTRRCAVLLFILSMLCLPSVAFADPVYMSPAPLVIIPLLFALEGVIIAYLGRRSGPRWVKFIVVWFLVTVGTCLGLAFFSLVVWMSFWAVLVGECGVVVIEAVAIYDMLRSPCFARNLDAAPSAKRALLYSLIANVFSLVSSVVAFVVAGVLAT